MTYWLDTLNKYSNLLLVIITVVYAGLTYKMVSAMKYQFTSDIKLRNKKLGSTLEEDWFKERVKTDPEGLKKSRIFCKLCFDIYNKKPGGGSISKPNLIIKFSDGFKIRLNPSTKEHERRNIDENSYEILENDLGASIYLRGHDLLNIELEYEKYNLDEQIIKRLRELLDTIEYYIEYTDNSENKYYTRLSNISATDLVGRK